MEQSKACLMCNQIKPFSAFPKHKRMANGINSRCKECHKLQTAKWRLEHRDKHLASQKTYHEKNRVERNAGRKKRYHANKDYYFEYRKAYYLRTADRQRQTSKNWRKNNPEKFMIQQRRRRAKEMAVPSEKYTWQEIVSIHGNLCWLCGKEIDLFCNRKPGEPGWQNGLHLDHVIPIIINGPDLKWNVQPTHGLCNMQRRKKF